MKCRFCQSSLEYVFFDLNNAPLSNSLLTREQLDQPETFFPLKLFVCTTCFLVQLPEYQEATSIFNNHYPYFSSYSESWLLHAKKYTDEVVARFNLDDQTEIIEIASNDGYLLQYFKQKSIPTLGIEPSSNTAEVAQGKGIETITRFFSKSLAEELVSKGKQADLLIGNNVLAHVPDIHDFVAGMKIILKETGVITMEFPHLIQLVDNCLFDTIYHEHYSYLSLYVVKEIFAFHQLEVFDVEEIKTHGGSLRIFVKHLNDSTKTVMPNVKNLIGQELNKGVHTVDYYQQLSSKALEIKLDFNRFMAEQKSSGKHIAGYGAAAKGNTLLNYCGIKSDLIDFVVDANPHKQNKYLPASHIPVVDEAFLKKEKPNLIIIFPWNLKDEIAQQLSYISEWGGELIVCIPKLEVVKSLVIQSFGIL